MMPFDNEGRAVAAALYRHLPDAHLHLAAYSDVTHQIRGIETGHAHAVAEIRGSEPLVVWSSFPPAQQQMWCDLAERIQGVRPIAIRPFRGPTLPAFARLWHTEHLDERPMPENHEIAARELLIRAAPAFRLDRALLRALRVEFFPDAGAAFDSYVWSRGEILDRGENAATLDLAKSVDLRLALREFASG